MRKSVIRSATTLARPETMKRNWWLVDASGQVLGRLAARLAIVLMGKHKTMYTPHVDTGDSVVVINASGVRVTGGKGTKKEYVRYTGWPSGLRRRSFNKLSSVNPSYLIKLAVRRMLPKNRLAQQMLRKLWVYKGPEHPHAAQKPVPWDNLWVKKRYERVV